MRNLLLLMAIVFMILTFGFPDLPPLQSSWALPSSLGGSINSVTDSLADSNFARGIRELQNTRNNFSEITAALRKAR